MEQAVDFVLRARDEASQALAKATGSVEGLSGAFASMAGAGGPVGLAAVALAGLGAAAIGAGIHLADTVRDLERLSQRTGVSVEDLQVFKQVISAAGGDSDGLAVALTKFNKAIAEGNPYLKQMNVTTHDTREAFMQVAAAFANGTDKTKQAAIAMSLFGRSGGDFIALLPQIAANFDQFKSRMGDTGAIITGNVVPAAQQLHEHVVELSIAWEGAMTRMQAAVLPVADAFTNLLNLLLQSKGGVTGHDFENRALVDARQRVDDIEASLRTLRATSAESAKNLGLNLKTEIAAATDALRQAESDLNNAMVARGYAHYGPDLTAADAKQRATSTDVVTTDKTKADTRTKGIEKYAEGFRQMGESATRAASDAAVLYDQLQKLDTIGAVRGAERRLSESYSPLSDPEVRAAFEAQKKQEEEANKTSAEHSRVAGRFGLPYEQAEPLNAALASAKQKAEQLRAIDEVLRNVNLDQSQRHVLERVLTKAAMAEFYQNVQDTLRLSNVVRDGLGAVYQGLGQGFETVAQGMVHRGQTLGSALKSIFDSLVSSILSALARLATAKLFQFALSFIPGIGSFAGIATNSAVGGGTSLNPADQLFAPASARPIVVNLSTLDTQSAAGALGPGGSLRQAFNQQTLARAY